ncbi:MAG: serine protein kinase RIO [Candidatus Diapherotrites archaeon]
MDKTFKDENLQRTFAYVFDASTIQTIYKLATKGHIQLLEFVISTGKEAHVFRALDQSGGFRAVKVYKTDTSTFQDMMKYIKGDQRFEKVGNDKREIVAAWTQKEFKNLELCRKANVSAPLPFAFLNNVLVMEFIGENGIASPSLREVSKIDIDWEDVYAQVIENMSKLLYDAKLVHADLSEYNMLFRNGKVIFIDLGQAVLSSHPNAREFFDRDVKNLSNYFRKKGLDVSAEKMTEELRKRKPKTA